MAPSTLSNAVEGRERLARSRLRWLESNGDGTPPPQSPWAYSGPRHTGSRRRATHRRNERTPRWESPIVATPSPSTSSAENNEINPGNTAGGSNYCHSAVTLFASRGVTSPAGSSSSTVGQNRDLGRCPGNDKVNGNTDAGVDSTNLTGETFRSRVSDARARVRRYALALPVRSRLRVPAFHAMSSSASSDGGSGQSSDDQGLSSGTEDAGSVVHDYDDIYSSGSPSAFTVGDCWREASPPPPQLPQSRHDRRMSLSARASLLGGRVAAPSRPEKRLASLGGEREQDASKTGSALTDGREDRCSLVRTSSLESLSEVSAAASEFESEDLPGDPHEGYSRSRKQMVEMRATMLAGNSEQVRSSEGATAENEVDANSRRDSRGETPVYEEIERRSRRDLEEEIVLLKQKLRNAELKQTAAEATAASALQRARAAEVTRDAKDIQIRNLEVKLARYTKSDKYLVEACAQWKKRFQDTASVIPPEFRRREHLPAVAEEPSSLCDPSGSSSSSATHVNVGSRGPLPAVAEEPSSLCDPSGSTSSSATHVNVGARGPLPAVAEEPSSLCDPRESNSSCAARVNVGARRRPSPGRGLVLPSASRETSLSPVQDCDDGDDDCTVHVWGPRRKKLDGRSRRGVGATAARAVVTTK